MSTEHEATLVVGFEIRPDHLINAYGRRVEEETHTEPRYDVRTGGRVEDEVVVDRPAGTVLTLPGSGEEYFLYEDDHFENDDRLLEFCETLADSIGCAVYYNDWLDETDTMVFGPEIREKSPTIGQLVRLQQQLDRIKLELRQHGLECEEPVVVAILSEY